jgi:hypothetical protein
LTHEEFLVCHELIQDVQPKMTYANSAAFLYNQLQPSFVAQQKLMGVLEDICEGADEFVDWLENAVDEIDRVYVSAEGHGLPPPPPFMG